MDILIKKIAALGVPGLVLMVAIELTGLTGAAAITAALAALGPFGMIGGIMTLFLIGVISEGITEYGFDAVAESVIRELYCKGESKESIKRKISRYPISSNLQRELIRIVDLYA